MIEVSFTQWVKVKGTWDVNTGSAAFDLPVPIDKKNETCARFTTKTLKRPRLYDYLIEF